MFSPLTNPGTHQPIFAAHGMVSTSQPLAAAAGLQMLQRGGTAVDAAIATAAALTVVEPCSNGLGSDAFALVWDGSRVHGINGSGRAPAALSAETLTARGQEKIPLHGWESVTIPGAVAAWAELHARFGKLPFATLLEPAIEYAERGFPVSGVVSWGWGNGVTKAHAGLAAEGLDDDAHAHFLPTFTTDGRPPQPGEWFRLPDHAATLARIADTNGADLYSGQTAAAIAAFAQQTGGYITEKDLAAHTSTWVDPISTSYRSVNIWEIPPNGQGIAALIALNILEGFDPADVDPDTPLGLHRAIEAMKLALTDAHAFVADPQAAEVPTEELLSPEYAAQRRALIGSRAAIPTRGTPRGSDTVYLAAADQYGTSISFIQSNYHGFGAHIVVPGTGVSLQNRGYGFSLDPAHPNVLAPNKRPYHTIIPGFMTVGDRAVGPFGVMGGHTQPQGHVQMVLNTVDRGENPQASLDRPRWYWQSGLRIMTEDDGAVEPLRALGHDVEPYPSRARFGRGQIIWSLDGVDALAQARAGQASGQAVTGSSPAPHDGATAPRSGQTTSRNGWVAGSDPRADGVPMGW